MPNETADEKQPKSGELKSQAWKSDNESAYEKNCKRRGGGRQGDNLNIEDNKSEENAAGPNKPKMHERRRKGCGNRM